MEIGPISAQNALQHAAAAGAQQADHGFADTLKASIQAVNQVQVEADQAVQDLVRGNGQSLHETLIALEKADMTFQLMMQTRNKILAAYEEIFRMQL